MCSHVFNHSSSNLYLRFFNQNWIPMNNKMIITITFKVPLGIFWKCFYLYIYTCTGPNFYQSLKIMYFIKPLPILLLGKSIFIYFLTWWKKDVEVMSFGCDPRPFLNTINTSSLVKMEITMFFSHLKFVLK